MKMKSQYYIHVVDVATQFETKRSGGNYIYKMILKQDREKNNYVILKEQCFKFYHLSRFFFPVPVSEVTGLFASINTFRKASKANTAALFACLCLTVTIAAGFCPNNRACHFLPIRILRSVA